MTQERLVAAEPLGLTAWKPGEGGAWAKKEMPRRLGAIKMNSRRKADSYDFLTLAST